jgi:hypothetical protein
MEFSSLNESDLENNIRHTDTNSSFMKNTLKTIFDTLLDDKDKSFGMLFCQTQIFHSHMEEIIKKIANEEL